MITKADDRRRGAALFVVLIFAIVIANLAVIALRLSSSEIRSTAVFVDGVRADELGRSLIPLTRYFISTDIGTRLRGGSFTVEFHDGRIVVDYLSESARVDVNHSPVDLIAALLRTAGLSRDHVEDITRSLNQRRSSRQANRYESTFEIADDWVLSNAEAREIVPLLTTANNAGGIDPLLAGQTMLEVLFDGSEERVAQFQEKRMIGFPDEQTILSFFSERAKKWIKFGAPAPVRAVARVTTRRGLRRRFEAVFDPQTGKNGAKIYYWRPLS